MTHIARLSALPGIDIVLLKGSLQQGRASHTFTCWSQAPVQPESSYRSWNDHRPAIMLEHDIRRYNRIIMDYSQRVEVFDSRPDPRLDMFP